MSFFKLAHLNVRSLIPKYNDVRQFVIEGKYDVVAITETWLNSTVQDEDIQIQGYFLVRQDRMGRGGGVAIYYKTHLSMVPQSISRNPNFEQVWLNFSIDNKSYTLGCVYRPPSFNC